MNAFATVGWPSRKITDSPAAIVVTPLRAIAVAKLFELSSILKPVMSTGCAQVLVSSIQSAPTGLSPLLHGATSETISVAGAGAAVTVTVSGALVASGVAPTETSSTATVVV